MKKVYFLLTASLSLLILIFSFICGERKIKGYISDISEFGILWDSKIIKLGDSIETVNAIGQLEKFEEVQTKNGMFYHQYDYGDCILSTAATVEESDRIIFIIKVTSKKIKTLRDVAVGDNKQQVLKNYGLPHSIENGYMYYYNDDYDHLEIRFHLKKDVIDEIVISMGT